MLCSHIASSRLLDGSSRNQPRSKTPQPLLVRPTPLLRHFHSHTRVVHHSILHLSRQVNSPFSWSNLNVIPPLIDSKEIVEPFATYISITTQIQDPTMACSFLNQLAPELRTKSYEYVLDFDRPLRHVNHLQPFVKRLTEADGELPVGYQNQAHKDDVHEYRIRSLVNTSILSTSEAVYSEAIETLYDINTIRIDIELCRLANITNPI